MEAGFKLDCVLIFLFIIVVSYGITMLLCGSAAVAEKNYEFWNFYVF